MIINHVLLAVFVNNFIKISQCSHASESILCIMNTSINLLILLPFKNIQISVVPSLPSQIYVELEQPFHID